MSKGIFNALLKHHEWISEKPVFLLYSPLCSPWKFRISTEEIRRRHFHFKIL